MPLSQVIVSAPSSNSYADGATPTMLAGKAGEGVVTELHGKWYTQSYRGGVFTGTVAGVTIPQNASNLVSVFSLYNPPGSNKNLELISTDIAFTSATTVLDILGWYGQGGSSFTVPTSQTVGTPLNMNVGNGNAAVGRFLTAGTHIGTPVLYDILANMLTTSTVPPGAVIHKEHDGKIILPPNSIITLAASTAAWTASAATLAVVWGEVPL